MALALTACGGGGDDSSNAGTAARTIEIEMRDTSFSPSALTVKEDEELRFVFTNTGKLQHAAFVGNEMEQEQHEAEMRGQPASGRMAGMDHPSTADDGVTVPPGQSDEIQISFRDRGEQIVGCHEPGHYAAGMKVVVTVE